MTDFYVSFMANLFESYDDMVNQIKEDDSFLVMHYVSDKSAILSITMVIDAGFEVHYILVGNRYYYYCLDCGMYCIFLIKEV